MTAVVCVGEPFANITRMVSPFVNLAAVVTSFSTDVLAVVLTTVPLAADVFPRIVKLALADGCVVNTSDVGP